MSFQERQPNYFDYLESRLGENISADNYQLITSFDTDKFTEFIENIRHDINHFRPIWRQHLSSRAPASKLCLPYDYVPPELYTFSPALISSQFNISINMSMLGNDSNLDASSSTLLEWIKKSLLLCHTIVLPMGIDIITLFNYKTVERPIQFDAGASSDIELDSYKYKTIKYLDLIYQCQHLIKANIIQFVPSAYLIPERDFENGRDQSVRNDINILTEYADTQAGLKLPDVKKTPYQTNNEAFISTRYRSFEATKNFASALGTTVCFGKPENIALIELINSYQASTCQDPCIKQANSKSSINQDNASLMRLLSLDVPDLKSLKLQDLIDIRRNSDALDNYRSNLKLALSIQGYNLNKDWLKDTSQAMQAANQKFKHTMKETNLLSRVKQDAGELVFKAIITAGVSILLQGAKELNDHAKTKPITNAVLNHYAIWK